MGKISQNASRLKALTEQLEVLRDHMHYEVFRAISTAWLHQLSSLEILSRTTLGKLTTLDEEKLHKIALFSTPKEQKPRGWTKTWAEAAYEITRITPDISESMRFSEKDTQLAWAQSCLSAVSVFAQDRSMNVEHAKEIIQAIYMLIAPARRPSMLRSDALSAVAFSASVRESLPYLNAELEYLTLDQIDSLEKCLQHRALWVQGPSGSGKTIFGIEAGSRSLRAGLRVLFVYRSTQFGLILRDVLRASGETSFMLQHQSFDQLLDSITEVRPDKTTYRDMLANWFPELNVFDEDPIFDLVIVDDCETFDTHIVDKAEQISELGARVIMISASHRVISHPIFGAMTEQNQSDLEELGELLSQPLEPPTHFKTISLTRNLRNARKIANYIEQLCDTDIDAAMEQPGSQDSHQTTWQTLAMDLLAIVEKALDVYEPQQIKILTDPYLRCLCKDEPLEPLAKAVLQASENGSFNESFLQSESELKRTLKKHKGQNIFFISTDGYHVHSVVARGLRAHRERALVMDGPESRLRDRIENNELLEEDVFADPFRSNNAIMIYPSPLFIGLETEMVIYIRNVQDQYLPNDDVPFDLIKNIYTARQHHHYLAMCCAQHYLVDLKIQDS